MRHAGRPIHVGSPILKEAVEMQTGALVLQVVVDMNDDLIALVGIKNRWRPLPIDTYHGPLESIRTASDPADGEVVFHYRRIRTRQYCN